MYDKKTKSWLIDEDAKRECLHDSFDWDMSACPDCGKNRAGEIILYREIETTGCLFEDGADTRKTTEDFILIPSEMEDEYQKDLVSNYESQDYSYQFSSKEIIRLRKDSWFQIKKVLDNLTKEGTFSLYE